jgi:hypothetical protein
MLILGSLLWRTTGVGAPPAPPAPAVDERPKGTAEWLWQKAVDQRAPEDVRRARERFGVLPRQAAEAIAEVAARQVDRAEQDEQKRFDELLRELQLRSLEFEARYLDALAVMRERLIEEEKRRALARMREEEDILVLLLMAAANA